MADRVVHYITTGTNNAKVGFLAPDNFDDIGTALGVTKLEDNGTVDALSRVGDLMRNGQALRMHIYYEVGDETKLSRVICDIDKAASARAALVGKDYNGGKIKSASFPRRRRLV